MSRTPPTVAALRANTAAIRCVTSALLAQAQRLDTATDHAARKPYPGCPTPSPTVSERAEYAFSGGRCDF